MVAFHRQSLIRHIPTAGALVVGVAAAASFLLMPVDALEALVWRSGVAALVPVAQPPLGATARAVLALGSGVLGAAVVWSALYLLFGSGGFLVTPKRREDGVPVVRRADAHPDAPPRRPLSAADLGLPMRAVVEVEHEMPIPADLDQPLAAFDPHAMLPVPMAPVRPVPALTPPAPPPSERIDTFALPPVVVSPVEHAPPTPRTSSEPVSIEALLRRLEDGAGRRHASAN